MGLHELGTRALGMSKHSTMHCDFDIRQKLPLTLGLSQLGNVTPAELWLHSLASFRHRFSTIDTATNNRFRIRWLLLRSKGTKQIAQSPWTQLCPRCLAEDVEPYFRYWWRFSFVTECPTHKVPLLDRCPSCHNIIDFTISERSPPPAEDWHPLSRCPCCQIHWDKLDDKVISEEFLWRHQNLLLRALSDNWAQLPNGDTVMSPLFFDGCCQLIREMRRPPAGWKLFDRLVKQAQIQADRAIVKSMPFESLEINARREWLRGLFELLDDWPERLIYEARQVRFTLSYLRGQRGSSPYWVDKQGIEHLDRRWYRVSSDEKVAAIELFRRLGREPPKSEINAWVGKATPSLPNGLKKAWPGIYQENLPGLNRNDFEFWRAILIGKIVKILKKYCTRTNARRFKDSSKQLSLPFGN